MDEPAHTWDAWLEEARLRYHTDAQAAEQLARRVLVELPSDDLVRRATAQTILGSVAFVRGHLDEAKRQAEAVLALSAAGPSDVCEARLLLGACARRQGDLPAAVEHNRAALAVAEASDDADMEAVSRNNLGLALSDSGDVEGAMNAYMECLERFDATTEEVRRQLHGSVFNNLALLHRARGDHEAALERFQSAREACNEAGNRREAARIGRNLANTLLTLQRPAEAIAVLEEVAAHAQAIGGGGLLEILGQVSMGQAQLARGAPAEALAPLQRAVAQMEERADDVELGHYVKACALLAEAHAGSGTPEKGLEVLARVDALPNRPPPRFLRHLLDAEVRCLEGLERYREAVARMRALRELEHVEHERVLANHAAEIREQLELRERRQEAERLRSGRERLEELVGRRTEELRHALERAEAGDRAKTAFLAVASHELRTPLNAIVGYAEMVGDGLGVEEPAQLRADLDRVIASAELLTRHVDRILAMANLEAGAVRRVVEPLSVAEVAHTVASRCKRLVRPETELRVDVPEHLVVHGDAALLSGLLEELVHNALKFTVEGEVTVSASMDAGALVLWVNDTGAGIAPEVLERIFEPFSLQDDTFTRKHDGLGLGLTLARRHAELLGATLSVASVPDRGSRFDITFADAYAP